METVRTRSHAEDRAEHQRLRRRFVRCNALLVSRALGFAVGVIAVVSACSVPREMSGNSAVAQELPLRMTLAEQAKRDAARDVPRLVSRKSVMHLPDGPVQTQQVNGDATARRQDAVVDARRLAPNVHLVRVLAGDSLAKVAKQHNLPLRRLAILNRASERRVYSDDDVVCLEWKHRVLPDETLESIARMYNTVPELIRELNDSPQQSTLDSGMWIRVPSDFSYHHSARGSSYLRLVSHQALLQIDDPVRPESETSRKISVEEGDTLGSIGQRWNLSVSGLLGLNPVAVGQPLRIGQTLVVQHTVMLGEGAAIEDLLEHRRVGVAEMLAANGWQSLEDYDPAQPVNLPHVAREQPPRRTGRPTSRGKVYRVIVGNEAESEAVESVVAPNVRGNPRVE